MVTVKVLSTDPSHSGAMNSDMTLGSSRGLGVREGYRPLRSAWTPGETWFSNINMGSGGSTDHSDEYGPGQQHAPRRQHVFRWQHTHHTGLFLTALHLQFPFSPQCRDHSAFLSLLATMYYISPISHGGCLGILYYFSHNVSIMLLSDTLIEHENQNVVWNPSSKMDF